LLHWPRLRLLFAPRYCCVDYCIDCYWLDDWLFRPFCFVLLTFVVVLLFDFVIVDSAFCTLVIVDWLFVLEFVCCFIVHLYWILDIHVITVDCCCCTVILFTFLHIIDGTLLVVLITPLVVVNYYMLVIYWFCYFHVVVGYWTVHVIDCYWLHFICYYCIVLFYSLLCDCYYYIIHQTYCCWLNFILRYCWLVLFDYVVRHCDWLLR